MSKTVVLDANVLISAIVFGGKPAEVLGLVIDQTVQAIITEEITAEVQDTLRDKFHFDKRRLETTKRLLEAHFTLVQVAFMPMASRDPKDNHVLAVAHEVKLDYFISGDTDLLVLKKYLGVPLISVADFLDL